MSHRIHTLVAQHKTRVTALDSSPVPNIEYSPLLTIIEREKCITEGGSVAWLAELNPGVLKVVRYAELARRFGRQGMHFNARAAIERYQALQAGGDETPPAATI